MKKIILFLALFLMMVGSVSAVITGSETMTRTVPSTVQPSETFTVTYTAIGVSGLYGVSVVDTVTGGCEPVGEHKFVIADDASYKTTESFTYKAPSSGNCVFHGDYKYGTFPVTVFSDSVVTVEGSVPCVPNVVCSAWSTCINNEQTRSCSDGCGSTYTDSQSCSSTTSPVCGNGLCETGETASSCPYDCSTTSPACGNGICETGETVTSCPYDCSTTPPAQVDINVCQYFEWAKPISQESYCIAGIGILLVGLIIIGRVILK